jgi:hypothetical protein
MDRKKASRISYVDGRSKTKEYVVYSSIIRRCENPNQIGYKHYGARGIKMCPKWRSSFPEFLKDIGKIPFKGAEIERNDVNGDYEPGNCRWATQKEQANNKRSNHFVSVGSERLTLQQWSEKTGVNAATIRHRLKAGWTSKDAVFTL